MLREKFYHLFLPLILIFGVHFSVSAQVPTVQDCLGAIPICQSQYHEEEAYQGTGNIEDEINSSSSCLSSGEKNDVWYIFTVQETGELSFEIDPNDYSDDYDWAVYNLTNHNCEDIADTPEIEVSCNYSYMDGATGPNGGSSYDSQGAGGSPFNATIPVELNEIYVINVSQFSTSLNGYTIDFSESTADIYDTSPPDFLNVNPSEYCDSTKITCRFTENIRCESVSTDDFHLGSTSGGSPAFTITDVYSEACAQGAPYAIDFVISFEPKLENGEYALLVDPSTDQSILDNCGNQANPGFTIFQTESNYDINTEVNDISCHDYNDGSITANLDGAEGDIYYSFNGSPFEIGDGVYTDLSEGTYTIIARTETGCEAETQVEIINPPQAYADAGENEEICSSSEHLLSAVPAPAGIGTWTSSTPEVEFSDPNRANALALNLPLGTTYFTWTVDNGDCGIYTDTKTITRFNGNTFAGSDDGACEESVFQLSGNDPSPGTGIWTSNNASIIIENPSLHDTQISNIPFGEYTFNWTVDNGPCGILTDQVIIGRYHAPDEALTSEDQRICSELADISANIPVHGTGLWLTNGSATIESPTAHQTQAGSLIEGQNTFVWQITNGSCPPETDTVIIIRDLMPSEAIVPENDTICEENFIISTNEPETGTGEWSSPGVNTEFSEPNNYITEVSNLGFEENTITWTVSNGVCPPSSDSFILYRYRPPSTANAGEDFSVCENQANLNANTPDVGNGTWHVVNGNALVSTPSLSQTSASNLDNLQNTFVWQITNGNCPPETDTLVISYADSTPPVPENNVLPEVTANCDTFVNPPTAKDNCSGLLLATSSDTTKFDTQGIYTVNWIFTDENGNQSSQSQTIVIEDIENPEINCPSKLRFIADSSSYFQSYTIRQGDITVSASDNCGISDLFNTHNYTDSLTGERFEKGTHIVSWEVSDIAGNKSYCECEIEVIFPDDCNYCDIIIPEAFSPDENGKNDVFEIIGLEFYPEHKLSIFNRRGNKVLEEAPYKNDWRGENRFLSDNKKLPDGTYFYILELEGGKKPLKGYVYLKK